MSQEPETKGQWSGVCLQDSLETAVLASELLHKDWSIVGK
jgi:hypothetical protein